VFCRNSTAETYVVETVEELEEVLEDPHNNLVFVESVLDKYDSPTTLILGGHAFADTDYGPRGPQTVPGSQIELPARR
jgi:indolepyruvate decarboxylase